MFNADDIQVCPLPDIHIDPIFNENLWYNAENPLNVDGNLSEYVSPVDAVEVINWLNNHSTNSKKLAEVSNSVNDFYIDVNDDGYCSAIDAVLVINYLNQQKHSVPIFHSDINSPFKIFLDFDGGEIFWPTFGGPNNGFGISYPGFNVEGSSDDFNEEERDYIGAIYEGVAEDYAIFNVDVTTEDPGNRTNQVTAVIAIGGSWRDWFKIPAGGVAQLNGWLNDNSNTAFVFAKNFGLFNTKAIADAASHEAGHLFSLQHQSLFDENGNIIEEYNPGNATWAPIMGLGYNSRVTTWYDGKNVFGQNQNDIEILNKPWLLGLREDDFSVVHPLKNNLFEIFGLINSIDDIDSFSITVLEPRTRIQFFIEKTSIFVSNAIFEVKLKDIKGNIIKEISTNLDLQAGFSIDVPEGDYLLDISSNGEFGFLGLYHFIGAI